MSETGTNGADQPPELTPSMTLSQATTYATPATPPDIAAAPKASAALKASAAPVAPGAPAGPVHTVAPISFVTPMPERPFSWLDPHASFVIILVGPGETPFGIQKDFLCSKSAHYRQYFSTSTEEVENIVKLTDTSVDVFSHVQNYLFTGELYPSIQNLPAYDVLIGVWKLGHSLGIPGICDATIDAMIQCRQITELIPATPLLVQVWQDTPEGSSIRKLLLSWTAEYMRSSDSRAEFARSLPQEVLSELVVAMSSLESAEAAQAAQSPSPVVPQRRALPGNEAEENDYPPAKKSRLTADSAHGFSHDNAQSSALPTTSRKEGTRVSLPSSKPGSAVTSKVVVKQEGGGKKVVKRRSSAAAANKEYTTEQKLKFCADLLGRMLSGPGFWTRVVGPFKDPVDPTRDGVPDYFEKIKKPMDLTTMQDKMWAGAYKDEHEFLADMHLIFDNCKTYWKPGDPMYEQCNKLERSFNDKFYAMNKWLAKMEDSEEAA